MTELRDNEDSSPVIHPDRLPTTLQCSAATRCPRGPWPPSTMRFPTAPSPTRLPCAGPATVLPTSERLSSSSTERHGEGITPPVRRRRPCTTGSILCG